MSDTVVSAVESLIVVNWIQCLPSFESICFAIWWRILLPHFWGEVPVTKMASVKSFPSQCRAAVVTSRGGAAVVCGTIDSVTPKGRGCLWYSSRWLWGGDQLLFLIKKFFLLDYSCVLIVSAIQQSKSSVHIHMHGCVLVQSLSCVGLFATHGL